MWTLPLPLMNLFCFFRRYFRQEMTPYIAFSSRTPLCFGKDGLRVTSLKMSSTHIVILGVEKSLFFILMAHVFLSILTYQSQYSTLHCLLTKKHLYKQLFCLPFWNCYQRLQTQKNSQSSSEKNQKIRMKKSNNFICNQKYRKRNLLPAYKNLNKKTNYLR